MSDTNIINQVIELASDSFMIDSSLMKPHTTFLELEIDSLDFVDFIINVESHFDILIPEKEMQALWSLSLVADYVSKNLA
jgi:acyl carrier protein